MKNVKQIKGITLIALIITIIVLLILAGITINLTIGQDGILKMAEQSGENYIDAADYEREQLAELTNTADEIIDGTRNTQNINMCSPKLLVTAELPSTGESTRAIGTYKASSSEYTKTNTDDFSNYLSFQEGTGWKILKSGWYNLNAVYAHGYYNAKTSLEVKVIINDLTKIIGSGYAYESNSDQYRSVEDCSIYLEKDDIIDFEFVVSQSAGDWSSASFEIYAMFK